MPLFDTVRLTLVGTSFATLFLSFVFWLFPDFYLRIEQVVSTDIIPTAQFVTVLEGKINFLNDWIIKNRPFFGIVFVMLSLYNIKSLIVL